MNCNDVKQMIEDNTAKLIDVRNPMELIFGKASAAINIPLNQINQVSEMFDVETPLFVYCQSGNRSSHAKMILESMGFSNVENIGGIQSVHACIGIE